MTNNTYSKPDYSNKAYWYKMPEITKNVDTFYVYATEYILSSFDDGAPDYASFDNEEMLQGVVVEYEGHATTFADATNVVACPSYSTRQAYAMRERYIKRQEMLMLRFWVCLMMM